MHVVSELCRRNIHNIKNYFMKYYIYLEIYIIFYWRISMFEGLFLMSLFYVIKLIFIPMACLSSIYIFSSFLPNKEDNFISNVHYSITDEVISNCIYFIIHSQPLERSNFLFIQGTQASIMNYSLPAVVSEIVILGSLLFNVKANWPHWLQISRNFIMNGFSLLSDWDQMIL